jgi:hypothetical protein
MTSINQVDQYDSDDGFEDAFQRWMAKEKLDQPYVKEWFAADGMHDILMALGALEVQRFPKVVNYLVLWDVYGFSNGVDDLLEAMFEESR